MEVGRVLRVEKGFDRIRTRGVQADLSECRVAQSDSGPNQVADQRSLECDPADG